jgi:NifU-like protein involved in Fe-S cluster formation
MSSPLYSIDVLRMAARVADFPPLADAPLRIERRSPTCGSRMTVTMRLDAAGRIAAIGLDARACALGQAAAAILAAGAPGRDAGAIAAASAAWRAYLAGERDDLPDWPGLDLLAAGRGYPARHPSMRLAFEAAAAALAAGAEEANAGR